MRRTKLMISQEEGIIRRIIQMDRFCRFYQLLIQYNIQQLKSEKKIGIWIRIYVYFFVQMINQFTNQMYSFSCLSLYRQRLLNQYTGRFKFITCIFNENSSIVIELLATEYRVFGCSKSIPIICDIFFGKKDNFLSFCRFIENDDTTKIPKIVYIFPVHQSSTFILY